MNAAGATLANSAGEFRPDNLGLAPLGLSLGIRKRRATCTPRNRNGGRS